MVAQGIDQQREGRRRLAAARVIEVVARKRRAPVFEHPFEAPFIALAGMACLSQVSADTPYFTSLELPDRPAVEQREYHPWASERIAVDTAESPAAAPFDALRPLLSRALA